MTNDLKIHAEKIYEIYQKRWRIEEYHKSIKQNTSLEKSPTKVIHTQKTHIFASIIAYLSIGNIESEDKVKPFFFEISTHHQSKSNGISRIKEFTATSSLFCVR